MYFVFETDSHQIIRNPKSKKKWIKEEMIEQILMFRKDGVVDSGECHYIQFRNLAALHMVSSFIDVSMVGYDCAIQYVLSFLYPYSVYVGFINA